MEMLQNIQKSPLFDKMKKDCQAEGIEIPKTIMAKNPVAHMLTPQEYLQKVAGGVMPQMDNHQTMKQLAEKNDQTKILNDGVQGHRASASTYYATGTKTQVSHIALQTDTCDTLYVTKNTLTAYTIAIVQNLQALQYNQMHMALQTVRNQSSLETPLRVEKLLNAHFNLAVLADQKDVDIGPDAQKPAANIQDAEPSASAPDRADLRQDT